jgi:hypothetical protein
MTLALFIVGVTVLTLYGLTVSGHFPFEARSKELQSPVVAFVIGATLLCSGLAALVVIVTAWNVLPWTAIIIGGGAALLAGPLLLRAFPDDFVDGLASMMTFAVTAMVIALVVWAMH